MVQTAADRATARFKQLCCLAIGGEAVMPALVRELEDIVPSYGAGFFFADERIRLSNSYTNYSSPYYDKLYFENVHGRPGQDLTGTFPNAIKTEFGVRDIDGLAAFDGIDAKTFRHSDYFNEIRRPQGLHSPIRLYVHAPGRGRGLGSLSLHRSKSDPPWSEAERQRLLDLEPFIAMALSKPNIDDVPLTDSGASGLIIADADGVPQHFSPSGRRLLFLATFARLAPGTDFARLNLLPLPVVKICRELSRILAGEAADDVPVHHVRNVWGGFTFRAHPFERGAQARRIGITIEHQEPVAVKLVRGVSKLDLSRRQAEVCLLLANGASYETIAERLAISKHTAIAHGRWIYTKLDVHNRSELVDKLLA